MKKVNRREMMAGFAGIGLSCLPLAKEDKNNQVEIGWVVMRDGYLTFLDNRNTYTPNKFFYGKQPGWRPGEMSAKEAAPIFANKKNGIYFPVYANMSIEQYNNLPEKQRTS